MRQRSFPPAWYPDPSRPSRLRRWDGTAWTRDIRPAPGWVRSLPLAPGPGGEPKRRTSRRLWLLSGLVVAAAFTLAALMGGSGVADPDRISDSDFARRADALCGAARREILAVQPAAGSGGAAEGRRVEALAAGFERMVAGMRGLGVAPGERQAVERWLGAWDSYIADGHRRAAALELGDDDAAERANQDSAGPKRAVNRFASVNRMSRCLF